MSDSYTPISMLRGNSTVIDSTPIVDGQILFDETRKCLFMDNGSTREKYSGLGADSNIANVEDTTTASQPYTTGEFVVVEGQLYKVTASIATGDTFSVGTNIETDTVGSEITKINNDLTVEMISASSLAFNCSAGNYQSFQFAINNIPQGYSPVAFSYFNSGCSCTFAYIGINRNTNTVAGVIYNGTSQTETATISVNLFCIKTNNIVVHS